LVLTEHSLRPAVRTTVARQYSSQFGQVTNKDWKAFWITFGAELGLAIMYYSSVIGSLS
jgi:hypothetical protein